MTYRSVSGPKIANGDLDLEEGEEKDRSKPFRGQKAAKIHNQALLSGLSYCISSCSMILVNKYVLSSYNFNAGIFLMLYQVNIISPKFLSQHIVSVLEIFAYTSLQNFVSVVLVSILRTTGVISTEPLTWKLVRVWFPVNVIFVGMLITSIFRLVLLQSKEHYHTLIKIISTRNSHGSLKYINVAMVTILKNMTNVITAVGEMYLFKKHHGGKVWASLVLMVSFSLPYSHLH